MLSVHWHGDGVGGGVSHGDFDAVGGASFDCSSDRGDVAGCAGMGCQLLPDSGVAAAVIVWWSLDYG